MVESLTVMILIVVLMVLTFVFYVRSVWLENQLQAKEMEAAYFQDRLISSIRNSSGKASKH